MKVPDELVEAGCEAAFVPPISDDRRADMRAALEAVLPKVRERLLSDREIYEGASAESDWLNPHLHGDEAEENRQASCEPFKIGVEAAFDHAFPEETP